MSDHGESRRRCGGFCPLRSVMAMDFCPLPAWNDSWDDAQNNPSAAGAVSAIADAIGAASACAACEHTSCKRQVSGSIPLTGSQGRWGKCPLVFRFVERMLLAALSGSARTAVTDGGGGVDEAPN